VEELVLEVARKKENFQFLSIYYSNIFDNILIEKDQKLLAISIFR
jgi:hypothetical protein